MHVGTFGERFLRPSHFFSESPHVLCHPLAILDVHAGEVWKKKSPSDIDVTTIAYNTIQSLRLWQNVFDFACLKAKVLGRRKQISMGSRLS